MWSSHGEWSLITSFCFCFWNAEYYRQPQISNFFDVLFQLIPCIHFMCMSICVKVPMEDKGHPAKVGPLYHVGGRVLGNSTQVLRLVFKRYIISLAPNFFLFSTIILQSNKFPYSILIHSSFWLILAHCLTSALSSYPHFPTVTFHAPVFHFLLNYTVFDTPLPYGILSGFLNFTYICSPR